MNIDTPEGMRAAIAWQTQLVNVIAQGGRWVVPRSGSIYAIDHEGKQAKRLSGFAPEPTITRVFLAMGWKVFDIEDEL